MKDRTLKERKKMGVDGSFFGFKIGIIKEFFRGYG